jgi:hypothetical protein
MTNNLVKSGYESLIFNIRGFHVMVDADLASLYETETKPPKYRLYTSREYYY